MANSLAWISAGAATTSWVTGQSLGTLRNDFEGTLGTEFTVVNNLTVTDLGYWVVSGNNQLHTISLLTTGCVVLATKNINTTGLPVGFNFVSLSTPVPLTAGLTYFLAATQVFGGDQFYSNDTVITTTSDATAISSCYDAGFCPINIPADGSHCFGPLSFKYTVP